MLRLACTQWALGRALPAAPQPGIDTSAPLAVPVRHAFAAGTNYPSEWRSGGYCSIAASAAECRAAGNAVAAWGARCSMSCGQAVVGS